MLTFSELYATALPGAKGPRSARTLCRLYKTRGLDFRTIATAVGCRQCAIQVRLLNPSILSSKNFAADVKLPSSRPTIAQIQSLNAKLTPQGLSLKLVSKDLSQAVLVGTWNAVASLSVGAVYTGPTFTGPNVEIKVGDGLMWIGAGVIAVGLYASNPGVALAGGLIGVVGLLFAIDGGYRLDNPPPPEPSATAPVTPTPVTNSTSHDTVDQDDDSGPAQDPATLPNCTLFGIVPDGLSADQVVNAIANELGIGDTTGWGGSDAGGFLTGGIGNGGDPTNGGGFFGGGSSGGLVG